MCNLLSYVIFFGPMLCTTLVAAQSGQGSSRSKGVFLDDGQSTGGSSSSFSFSLGLKGSSINARSGGAHLQYVESESNDWGATVLYEGGLSKQKLRLALVYVTDLSAKSDCSIGYEVMSKSSTDHSQELLVKQTLNNHDGKPWVVITLNTNASDMRVNLKYSSGKQTKFDLSKGAILVFSKDAKVKQTGLPDNPKEQPVVEMIRNLMKKPLKR